MTRRDWIRRLAATSATVSAWSAGFSGQRAGAAPTDVRDVLRLNLAAFPALDLNSGSAMISHDREATVMLINRESDTDYHVLDPTCTHMGCRVGPYSISSNTSFCPCHSSEYDIAGHVLHGPALADLSRYTSRLEGSILVIEVPAFVHRIKDIAVLSSTPGNVRMRITFPTIAGAQYHIRFAGAPNEEFNIFPFATTPGSVANQTVFDGTGAVANVYVDSNATSGFFSLELLVFQVA